MYNIDNFTNSPFNLIMSYPQLNKQQLDTVYNRSNGKLRVINAFSFTTTNVNEIESKIHSAKKKIEEWKESKGLFGYYIADEPSISLKQSMSELTWTIRENDPQHVVWPAINQRFILNHLKEGFDVVGLPNYPVQTFDSLQSIFIMTEQGRMRMGNARAMWNIPQIFTWKVYYEQYKNVIDMNKEFPPTKLIWYINGLLLVLWELFIMIILKLLL